MKDQQPALQVVFEDNHLIAVNKPAGVLVQADETGDATLADAVKLYIKDRYNKQGEVFLGVVHRIDRPVSGVVVFARTSKALERMNRLFAERKVQKTYLAIVRNRPDPLSGNLQHFILKDHDRNTVRALEQIGRRTKDAKLGVLDYELLAEIDRHYLVEVAPKTGRPHQIRAQLAAIGCPIMGDVKYGFKHPNHDGSIHLHSWKLEFEHPVKLSPVNISAQTPNENYWRMFHNFLKE
jgi:23S rRNA pseudouridine1911/1915/1917 synthase